MHRRSIVLASLLGAACPVSARPRASATALRFGADLALVDSGLAPALRKAFALDTGIPVLLVGGPALPLLDALAAGELDSGLLNAPAAAAPFLRDSLLYDCQPIAVGNFVLVGPRGRDRLAMPSAAVAFARLAEQAAANPGSLVFVSANDGSGAHLAEQAAWRSAGVAPSPPWYRSAPAGASLIQEARALHAYALVERAAWGARGGAPLEVRVDGDPELVEQIDVMRSFRSPHPAGRLFVQWLAGPRGRAIVVARGGYRLASR